MVLKEAATVNEIVRLSRQNLSGKDIRDRLEAGNMLSQISESVHLSNSRVNSAVSGLTQGENLYVREFAEQQSDDLNVI
jgi:hypothetical protein